MKSVFSINGSTCFFETFLLFLNRNISKKSLSQWGFWGFSRIHTKLTGIFGDLFQKYFWGSYKKMTSKKFSQIECLTHTPFISRTSSTKTCKHTRHFEKFERIYLPSSYHNFLWIQKIRVFAFFIQKDFSWKTTFSPTLVYSLASTFLLVFFEKLRNLSQFQDCRPGRPNRH